MGLNRLKYFILQTCLTFYILLYLCAMFETILIVWTDCYADWKATRIWIRATLILGCMTLSWFGMFAVGIGMFHVNCAYSEWMRRKEFTLPFESLTHSYTPADYVKAKCTFYNEPVDTIKVLPHN
jgi:glucan phosphoethanolaminetransferase (alkaline phosphatase superfamily)